MAWALFVVMSSSGNSEWMDASAVILSVLGFALAFLRARVAKLADAPDLGSGGAILRGSSPLPGTISAAFHQPAIFAPAFAGSLSLKQK